MMIYTIVVNNSYLNNYFKKGKLKKYVVDFTYVGHNQTKVYLELEQEDIKKVTDAGFDIADLKRLRL